MIMYQYLKSYWKKTVRLLFIIIIYRHSVKNYIKFLVDSLKRYLVICLKEKILIIICAHSLILLFLKLELFIKGKILLGTMDLLYGVWYQRKLKNCDTLASFISQIRQWRSDDCPCRTCKNFIPNLEFIETN